MDWGNNRSSSNIEDRRGMGRSLAFGGGAVSIIGAILYMLLGGGQGDVREPPGVGGSGQVERAADQRLEQFVSVILADTEDTWPKVLEPKGVRYVDPRLVLFTGATESACGFARSAVGPFYCPEDQKVYLDLSFFEDLRRLGAPGDFAQAYVIAHEVGHHVQRLLGIEQKVRTLRTRHPAQANALSVRLELQADCFAGVWANHAKREAHLIEPGDLEEGLRAAAAIGDDRLQRRGQGYVVPESFTHGSSAQRSTWFKRGLEGGGIDACDTFGAGAP